MSGSDSPEPHFAQATVDLIASMLAASPPSAGGIRVLAIDGRSGAGKSSLASLLHGATAAPVVSLEYLYGGWDDLEGGIERLQQSVLDPLADGREASVPRYDWIAGSWGDPIIMAPGTDLIVEGVGALAPGPAGMVGVGVWLEAPEETRRTRVELRDEGSCSAWWDAWARQEDRLLALSHPAERASLVLWSG